MAGVMHRWRGGWSRMLGALLALQLGFVPMGMAPPVAAASAVQPAAVDMPCHHAGSPPADVRQGSAPHGAGCCDPGHCHCAVVMTCNVLSVPAMLRVAVAAPALRGPVAAPALRLAPDLRPPISG